MQSLAALRERLRYTHRLNELHSDGFIDREDRLTSLTGCDLPSHVHAQEQGVSGTDTARKSRHGGSDRARKKVVGGSGGIDGGEAITRENSAASNSNSEEETTHLLMKIIRCVLVACGGGGGCVAARLSMLLSPRLVDMSPLQPVTLP